MSTFPGPPWVKLTKLSLIPDTVLWYEQTMVERVSIHAPQGVFTIVQTKLDKSIVLNRYQINLNHLTIVGMIN